jgi:thiamine biosynthesis lipoprotein
MAAMLFALAVSARAPAPPADLAQRRVAAMGTLFDVTVRLAPRVRALEASEEAVAEVSRVENLLSTWRSDTPLARVNAAAPGRPIPLDPELFSVLAEVFRWSGRTRGAFDPTVLPLVRAWDIRGSGRVPLPEELASARAATGTGRFRLDAAARTISRLDGAAGIDEGAWGKGYALDRAGERLRRAGATDALLDLGGQILALGRGVGDTPWTVSVADPRDRQRPVARILLPPGFSISTSGNSERGRRVGGRRIGHLLDPSTGSPAPDFGAVSVVCPSGLVADILSTAFFVLGPREGLALSAELRRTGVANEVLFLVDHGARREVLTSPGWNSPKLSADGDLAVDFDTHDRQRRLIR